MIIIGILVALCLGFFALEYYGNGYSELFFVSSVFIGIILVFIGVTLPLIHMGYQSDILEFHSVQNTVAVAREDGQDLELAAYQMKVAESNQWLASIQYYNETVFDIWIPDEVMDLEPIK